MDFNFDIYRPKNKLVAKKGRLLISEPLSADFFFNRSIVFLTECNNEGAFGFILNEESKYKLSDIIEGDFKFNPTINYGGPVDRNTIHFFHTINNIEGSIQVTDKIYRGGNFDIIKNMAKAGTLNDNEIRFFIGYSGWAPKQLDAELEKKHWLIINSNTDLLFETRKKEDWGKILTNIDKKYKLWTNVPKNPSYN